MRITISVSAPEAAQEQDLLNLELASTTTIGDLKALIESDTQFSPASQHLYHNGQLLSENGKTLEELNIGDGEMLAMHVRNASRPRTNPSTAGGASRQRQPQESRAPGPDPETLRLRVAGDPRARADVHNQHPQLAAVIDDPQRWRELYLELQNQQAEMDMARQREIAALNDDPFNMEAQAKIAEIIRQEAVMENLQNAMEHNPEAFGRVHMLYIDVEVNGHKVKAFVDSGAQATIMSPDCAEACGIMRLVDKRYAGIARGVGTAAILGRVHSAQIKIGTLHLACSFTVMEGKEVDLLLGLDMLKRHQACIDLQKNKLIIQGDEVSFLGEADIPKHEEALADEPTVSGPGGTTVGGRSGAVTQPTEATPAASASGGSNFRGQGQTIGSSSSAPPAQAVPATTQSAEAIAQLQNLGFSRAEAIAALEATGGNVDYAAGLLFGGQ